MNLVLETTTANFTIAPALQGFYMTFTSNFGGEKVGQTNSAKFTVQVMKAEGATDEQVNAFYNAHKRAGYITVKEVGLCSLFDFTGKTFVIRETKEVDFASGKQIFYVVENENGDREEIAERFTEGYTEK